MSDLFRKDKKYIWHPFTQLVPAASELVVERAEGVYLYTEDNRKILDAISSWWVNLHGHSHPYITNAIADQAAKLEHVIFAGFTHEPAIQLAENLISILPDNQSKIFYSDNGSTAVEVGLKMAFQYWHNQGIDKKKIIAFKGAYHGDTFGAMSVGDRGAFTTPFVPYMFDVEFINCPNENNFDVVFSTFKKYLDKGDVGAFIFEPLVLGSAGMHMYSASMLDQLIAYAHNKEVVCIADEVFTGFGRTGKNFASDHLLHKPDIIAMSKGLTGGTMALGATSCTDRIIEVYRSSDIMKTFFHGHSFTANPIACAASNASFDLLVKRECQQDIKKLCESQIAFKEKLEEHEELTNVRTLGTILAMDIKTEQETSYVNEVRHKLYPYFLERNVLLRPLGNVIYILPPYITSDSQLETIYDTVTELLESDLLKERY